eukprot:3941861-Rhodomonas_salina.1
MWAEELRAEGEGGGSEASRTGSRRIAERRSRRRPARVCAIRSRGRSGARGLAQQRPSPAPPALAPGCCSPSPPGAPASRLRAHARQLQSPRLHTDASLAHRGVVRVSNADRECVPRAPSPLQHRKHPAAQTHRDATRQNRMRSTARPVHTQHGHGEEMDLIWGVEPGGLRVSARARRVAPRSPIMFSHSSTRSSPKLLHSTPPTASTHPARRQYTRSQPVTEHRKPRAETGPQKRTHRHSTLAPSRAKRDLSAEGVDAVGAELQAAQAAALRQRLRHMRRAHVAQLRPRHMQLLQPCPAPARMPSQTLRRVGPVQGWVQHLSCAAARWQDAVPGSTRRHVRTTLCIAPTCSDTLCIAPTCSDTLCIAPTCGDALCIAPTCGDTLCIAPTCGDALCIAPT